MFIPSAGSLLLHLLDWVRLHKADVDEKAREVLQSESPAEHHDYWDVVSATHTNNYTFRISLFLALAKSLKSQLSHFLCLASAGCQLYPARQVGGSQTNAGKAGCNAACCQERVQADG